MNDAWKKFWSEADPIWSMLQKLMLLGAAMLQPVLHMSGVPAWVGALAASLAAGGAFLAQFSVRPAQPNKDDPVVLARKDNGEVPQKASGR